MMTGESGGVPAGARGATPARAGHVFRTGSLGALGANYLMPLDCGAATVILPELDAAIRERREFKLTTDPHKCAFGRWYDSLKTDNVLLSAQLKKIDAPHQRIHHRGAEALAAMAAGDAERASATAHDIRTNELAGTLALFAEMRVVLREAQREIAVVARCHARPFAVAVDGIESVEHLRDADVDRTSQALLDASGNLSSAIRKRARDQPLAIMVELARVMAAA